MELKKIENAVVHCRTKEEAEALIKNVKVGERSPEFWINLFECYGESVCYRIVEGIADGYSNIGYYEKSGYTITEFSDLIEPEEQTPVLTAEEAIEWLGNHYYDGEFTNAFGGEYEMNVLVESMKPSEIVKRIAKRKSEHEKPEKKEPELEWVDICRIIEIDCDVKRCVYEEELPFDGDEKEKAESILKRYISEHDGNYFAFVEHVCRVKKD